MPDIDYAHYMREAISLARKGRFHTYPNPAVGAALVKNGEIVGRGWHHAAGEPHAEIECLEDAASRGVDPAGAAMFVTLEPCAHHGKTPPCVDALLNARLGQLVYGIADPNPQAAGGAKILAEAGMEVTGPILEDECRDLIADFLVWRQNVRPYVILKLAATLDGRIATRTGHSRWISNEFSRKKTHDLRAAVGAFGGAVLIGGGTFRADNPSLDARDVPTGPQPLACIMTSRLPKADADFKLLRERPEQTVFFASPAATASTTAEALRKIGCRVIAVGPNVRREPDLAAMMQAMRHDLGCPYVLCEGGGSLALSLLEAGFVDEFHLHLAPIILGDNDARPLFDGRAPLTLDEALNMRLCSCDLYQGDAHLVLRPNPARETRH